MFETFKLAEINLDVLRSPYKFEIEFLIKPATVKQNSDIFHNLSLGSENKTHPKHRNGKNTLLLRH